MTTRRWVEWFARKGHEVTLITVEPAEKEHCTLFRQVDVGFSIHLRKIGRLLSAIRMAWILRQIKPDVVHLHYVRGLAWGILLHPSHPCVATPWGSDVLEEQGAFRSVMDTWLTRAVLRKSDLVTVHSEYMRKQVEPLLLPKQSMVRIGWGIDLQRFHPGIVVQGLRERWNISEAHRVIFSPRLCKPFYNHQRVIKALPTVCKSIPNTILVISQQFAEASYVSELRLLASQLGVSSHVRFVGEISYEGMPAWYNLADAVVMVPHSDGMPNSLLEAMACGAVPVLKKLPQYDEIIQHEVNGFLADLQGMELENALITVLSDSGIRVRMAEKNTVLVQEIGDQAKEMGRMECWYEQLVADSLGTGEKQSMITGKSKDVAPSR